MENVLVVLAAALVAAAGIPAAAAWAAEGNAATASAAAALKLVATLEAASGIAAAADADVATATSATDLLLCPVAAPPDASATWFERQPPQVKPELTNSEVVAAAATERGCPSGVLYIPTGFGRARFRTNRQPRYLAAISSVTDEETGGSEIGAGAAAAAGCVRERKGAKTRSATDRFW